MHLYTSPRYVKAYERNGLNENNNNPFAYPLWGIRSSYVLKQANDRS